MIGALILGFLAGSLARLILPGKQDLNILLTILLGLGGAIVGYLIFNRLLGIGDHDVFDLGGLLGAVIGSLVLLYAFERLAGQGPSRPPRSRDIA
jgi:uncharacterized membrane protein YeaQ/YmgE (transglycosylase-associated protein family)